MSNGDGKIEVVITPEGRPARIEVDPADLEPTMGDPDVQQSLEIHRYSLARMSKATAVKAVIWLYGEDHAIARLEFDGILGTKPLVVWQYPWGPVLNIPYHYEAYADVVDILRNEAPLHLTFHINAGYARVCSGDEPVGEMETAI